MTTEAGQGGVVGVSTAHLRKKERFAFWQDVSRNPPVGLDISAPAPLDFDVTARGVELGGLRVMQIKSSASRILRRPDASQDGADHVVLNFVRSGSLMAEQDGRSTLVRAGEAALCVADRPFSLQFADPLDVVVFKFPRNLYLQQVAMEKVTATNLSAAGQAGAFLHNYAVGFSEHVHTLNPLLRARISRNIMDILETTLAFMAGDEIDRKTLHRHATLLRIKALVNDELANTGLSVGLVAARMGLSPRYINKLFSGEGVSLGRFILRRRVENAARDLADPNLAIESIGTIARKNGFADISHFSHSFRARYGVSPTAYRGRE